MAILDFLKNFSGIPGKPDYEITDVDFGEGYENVKPGKFGTEVSQYAAYVYARLHVKVNRPFEAVWRVKIFAPGGKLIQGKNTPEGYAGTFRCRFPETGHFFMLLDVGNRMNEFFTGLGAYGWVLCEEDGTPIKSKFFYTVSPDEHKRRKGYMSIKSVEFSFTLDGSDFISDFKEASECQFTTDIRYLKCRLKYNAICDEEKNIKLDIEIEKPGGSVSRFDTDAVVSSTGGTLVLPGWGNDKATCYYNPGNYIYRILFEGNVLCSRELKFERSIRDNGMVRILSLTLHKKYDITSGNILYGRTDGLVQPHLDVSGNEFLYPVICFVNYSPDDVEFLLKIYAPDGRLVEFDDGSAPEGFTTRGLYKNDIFYVKGIGYHSVEYLTGFQNALNGSFVKGEYRMSLYVRNWHGDMVCLKVSRVRVS